MVYICDFICFLFGPQAGVLFLSIISFFHLLSWLWHPVSVLLGLVEMTISEFNASESDLHRFGDAFQRGWPWKVSSLSLPYPCVIVNVWIYFGFTSQSYCIVHVHLGFPTLVFLLSRLLHFLCGMSLVQVLPEVRGVVSPGAGVTASSELSGVGSGIWTQVLSKSNVVCLPTEPSPQP